MALIQMDFMADTIQRWTTAMVYLPDQEADKAYAPFKTLVLLHGYGGNHKDWTTYSNVVRYAMKHHMAIIMPEGENSYFLDFPERHENFEKFISEELLRLMTNTFPLSKKREDTFIAGLSMGGGAAIRMGLRRGDVFSKAMGLSAGLTVHQEAVEVGHHADIYEAYETAKKEGRPMAKMYLAIGDEDPLLDINREFHAFLEKEGVEHTYEEYPGTHNWDFWDGHIRDVLGYADGEER